jgi:hypothetical protein
VRWYQRFAALLCAFTLTSSALVECAGWQATPEARRSCCGQSANCLHNDDQDGRRAVSQAAADSCCAASESDESRPSSTPFAAGITVAGLQAKLPALAPLSPLTVSFDTQELVGLRASPVPKHLLLSVFLV